MAPKLRLPGQVKPSAVPQEGAAVGEPSVAGGVNGALAPVRVQEQANVAQPQPQNAALPPNAGVVSGAIVTSPQQVAAMVGAQAQVAQVGVAGVVSGAIAPVKVQQLASAAQSQPLQNAVLSPGVVGGAVGMSALQAAVVGVQAPLAQVSASDAVSVSAQAPANVAQPTQPNVVLADGAIAPATQATVAGVVDGTVSQISAASAQSLAGGGHFLQAPILSPGVVSGAQPLASAAQPLLPGVGLVADGAITSPVVQATAALNAQVPQVQGSMAGVVDGAISQASAALSALSLAGGSPFLQNPTLLSGMEILVSEAITKTSPMDGQVLRSVAVEFKIVGPQFAVQNSVTELNETMQVLDGSISPSRLPSSSQPSTSITMPRLAGEPFRKIPRFINYPTNLDERDLVAPSGDEESLTIDKKMLRRALELLRFGRPDSGAQTKDSDGKKTSKTIFNGDHRHPVGDSIFSPPWCAVVKIFAIYPGGVSEGTGALIGGRLVLTAAHVVYKPKNGGRPLGIRVVPALNGTHMPFGDAFAISLYVDHKYIESFIFANDPDFFGADHDIALISLDRDFSSLFPFLGFCRIGDPENELFDLPGYPSFIQGATNGVKELTEMFTDWGYVDHVSGDTVRFNSVDTTPGNSGGPMICYKYPNSVFAVNNKQFDSTALTNAWNSGTRISKGWFDLLIQARNNEKSLQLGEQHKANNWTNINGTTPLPIFALIFNDFNNIIVFAVGVDGGVYFNVRQGIAIGGVWFQNWGMLADATTRKQVFAVSRDNHDIDIFITTPKGTLLTRRWTYDFKGGSDWWPTWAALGSPPEREITSAPTVISRTPESMDIFVIARKLGSTYEEEVYSNYEIWHLPFQNDQFGDWEKLGDGVSPIGPITAISRGKNQMEIFALNFQGNIVYKMWTGGTWLPLSQESFLQIGNMIFATPPVAVSWDSSRMDLFCVDGPCTNLANGQSIAMNTTQSNLGLLFGGGIWTSLAATATSVTAISRNFGLLDIFIRDIQGKLCQASWDESKKSWKPQTPNLSEALSLSETRSAIWNNIGGQIIEAPFIVKIPGILTASAMMIFVRDRNLNVNISYFDGNKWVPG